ncbi:F0F1 ATP synthase subunit A [Chloroflexota bacterium]
MPKKGRLGCSSPVMIGVLLVILALTVISFLSGALGKSLVGDVGLPSWLSASKPHVQLPAEGIFHLFGFTITNTIITSWLTIIVLVAISYAATHRIKLIPSRLQNLLEFTLEWMLNFCIEVAGEKYGRRFFPIVTTIFLFVLFNAWLSLLPGFGSILITSIEGHEVPLLRGANTDINMPLALALISFAFVEYYGIRTLGGLHYLRKFVNFNRSLKAIGQLFKGKIKDGIAGLFYGGIDIFVGMLETMGEIIRVISFTFRLFGNMTGGEILLLTMMFLVPWVLAIPFYGLELLVGLIQAIIFGGLTLVFATVAIRSHEHE